MIRRILPQLGLFSRIAIILFALILALPLAAQVPAAWTTPFPPFRIAGNLYYVGSEDLAA